MKVVIAEKYNQGELIANTILDNPNTREHGDASYWTDGEITVVPLAGQIFELTETESRSGYPDFPELEWTVQPDHIDRTDFLSDNLPIADEIIIGTDYDREGELIGTLGVLLPLCGEIDYELINQENVTRMEYSALTEDAVEDAWKDRGDPDEELFDVGRARAVIDYRVGINLSRALTQCLLRGLGEFHSLSAGRVQTPLLRLIHDRCQERRNFDPDTYWVPEINVTE